jgi:O-methyltransferase domain/Dimerisation domain
MTDVSPPGLIPLITGFMASRVIQVTAELGIADLPAQGARTSQDLGAQAQVHAPSLRRLMRALASLGLLDEIEPGTFARTALGAELRSGVPGSLRPFAMMSGTERTWRCWSDLSHCVRTGGTAKRHLYGIGSFECLAAHPEEGAIFSAAMAENTRRIARAVVAAYDFSGFRTLIDVGGGNGALMATILAATPRVCGASGGEVGKALDSGAPARHSSLPFDR